MRVFVLILLLASVVGSLGKIPLLASHVDYSSIQAPIRVTTSNVAKPGIFAPCTPYPNGKDILLGKAKYGSSTSMLCSIGTLPSDDGVRLAGVFEYDTLYGMEYRSFQSCGGTPTPIPHAHSCFTFGTEGKNTGAYIPLVVASNTTIVLMDMDPPGFGTLRSVLFNSTGNSLVIDIMYYDGEVYAIISAGGEGQLYIYVHGKFQRVEGLSVPNMETVIFLSPFLAYVASSSEPPLYKFVKTHPNGGWTLDETWTSPGLSGFCGLTGAFDDDSVIQLYAITCQQGAENNIISIVNSGKGSWSSSLHAVSPAGSNFRSVSVMPAYQVDELVGTYYDESAFRGTVALNGFSLGAFTITGQYNAYISSLNPASDHQIWFQKPFFKQMWSKIFVGVPGGEFYNSSLVYTPVAGGSIKFAGTITSFANGAWLNASISGQMNEYDMADSYVLRDGKVVITCKSSHYQYPNCLNFTAFDNKDGSVCNPVNIVSISNVPAVGGVLTISGSYLQTINEVIVGIPGVACPILSQSASKLTVRVPPGTPGTTVRLTLAIDTGYLFSGVSGTFNKVIFRYYTLTYYYKPEIHRAELLPSTKNNVARALTTPHEVIAIYGSNFGNKTDHRTARIGNFPCKPLVYISDKLLHCTIVSGYGANHQVEVIVNGDSSLTDVTGISTIRHDFQDVTTPGLNCNPPAGAADAFNSEVCNCWSGYAPSTPEGIDCNVRTVCASVQANVVQVGLHAPSRPETNFKGDVLYIKQTQPIVGHRRDTNIQFITPKFTWNVTSWQNSYWAQSQPGAKLGAQTCFYPGNIWVKKVNNLDCVDEYYGQLAWSQHELCGFAEDILKSTYTHRVFVSTLVTSVTETYTKHGKLEFRKSTYSYELKVKFATKLTVISTPVSVFIPDAADISLALEIVESTFYDVTQGKVILKVKSNIVWPYQFDITTPLVGDWTSSTTLTPGAVSALAVFDTNQAGCTQTRGEDCEQQFEVLIDVGVPPQVCDLKGKIEFNTGDLLCRDYTSVQVCSSDHSTNTTFSINIGNTHLCDTTDIDATAGLTSSLTSYYDAALENPQNIFQTGDTVYFKVVVNNPLSTIASITFNTITIHNTDTGVADGLWSVLSGVGNATNFNITKEMLLTDDLLHAGADGVLNFQVRLNRGELDTLKTVLSASTPQQLQIQAVIDINYHGNNKRSIIPATAESHQVSTTILLSNNENNDYDSNIFNNNDESSYNYIFGESSAVSYLYVNMYVEVWLLVLGVSQLLL